MALIIGDGRGESSWALIRDGDARFTASETKGGEGSSETAADDTPEDMERRPAERTQTSPSNRDVYCHDIREDPFQTTPSCNCLPGATGVTALLTHGGQQVDTGNVDTTDCFYNIILIITISCQLL